MISGIWGTTAFPNALRRSTRFLTPTATRGTPSHSPLRQSARPQAAKNALSASSSDRDCHASCVVCCGLRTTPSAVQASRIRCRKQDAAAKASCPRPNASVCDKLGKASASSLASCLSGCGPCDADRAEIENHIFRKLFSGSAAVLGTVSIPSRPFKSPCNPLKIPSEILRTSGSANHSDRGSLSNPANSSVFRPRSDVLDQTGCDCRELVASAISPVPPNSLNAHLSFVSPATADPSDRHPALVACATIHNLSRR